MLGNQDYYSHTVPPPVKITQSNNISNTYIITTSERNKLIYPNPYECVINFDSTITDITEIEIIRLYYNLSLPLVNEYNNKFEFHIFINGKNYLFNMNLGEIFLEDYGILDRLELAKAFNNQYILKLENYISSWHDKNISNLVYSNNNTTFDYPLLKLFLNYSTKINRFVFYTLSDSSYRTPSNITSPGITNNSYNGTNTRSSGEYSYSTINYAQFGFDIRSNEVSYNNTRTDTGIFNYNSNNTFLELLGFSTKQDIFDNQYDNAKIDMSIYTREYLDTSFKVIGVRIKYNDNSISIIGNHSDNIMTNGDYESQLNFNYTDNSIENAVSPISSSPIISLPNSENKLITDILYNVEISTIYYQVVNITIKKDSSEIYNQIKYALQSNDNKLGIKIEKIVNNIITDTFYMENFEKPQTTNINSTYDLSYFNNIYTEQLNTDGKYSPYSSIKTFTRNIGYLGYIESPDGTLNIKWGRLNTETYGNNELNGITLNNQQIKNIITSNTDENFLFNNIITAFALNDFNGVNGVPIYNVDEYSIQEPGERFFTITDSIIVTLNFFFSDLIPNYNSFEYILLDIKELNNNNSNKPDINDSFIEIPIRNLNLYEMNNIGFSTKYFNPPLAKLNKLSIKLKTASGDIIDGTKYNGDLTLFLKIKQLNSSTKYIIN